MAHSDRDQMRYAFKHHETVCEHRNPAVSWFAVDCDCDRFDYRYWKWPEDPKFHADCRREERRRAAALMQRARAGHLDWDDLTFGYRRPYYW